MGKNIFERPLLKSQPSRNLFDLSHKTVFHAPFGMILPCGHWRLAPDDNVEISEENQFIVPTIKRPAFMRLKEHIDYYFVSYNQLCTFADNFFTQQSYYWSTAISKQVNADLQAIVPNQMVTMQNTFVKAMFENMHNFADIFTYPQLPSTLRLFDLLGYGNMYGSMQLLGDSEVIISDTILNRYLDLNLFNFLAYQKIYYDHFRNDAYEANKVYAYNIDDIAAGTVLTDSDYNANPERFRSIFEVHYRWKKKDYFTNTCPNNLPDNNYLGFEGGDFALQNSGTITQNDLLNAVPGVVSTGVGQVSEYQTRSNAAFGNGVGSRSLTSSAAGPTNTSVQAIRFAFAYDKLLRRMREAGQDFDKQMLSQFGINPIDQRHGKCYYIGGFTNRLNSTSVNNTTSTDLGNIGGNIDVYSKNNRPLRFKAKEHGILMAVYSTSLDFDYPSTRVDRENIAKHRFDWQHPAFEKQGKQPIFGFEYRAFKGAYGDAEANSRMTDVIGLVDRYSEYKTHVDELHGLFNPDTGDYADLLSWVINPFRNDYTAATPPLSMNDLVFAPNILDQIVPIEYDGYWEKDPFIINMYHRIKKISNMSVYGEDFGH